MTTTTQILEETQEERATRHSLAQGRTFVWHQVFGATSKASLEFYTKAFGWGTDEMPMGEGGAYKVLTANGSPVAGVIGTEEGCEEARNVAPHWAISIAVDDVEQSLEACKSLGAQVLHGPAEVPNVGRVALIRDPQGATFWIFQGC
jgi:predicted enzyme related to lactoylglutathione lyase